MKGVKQEASRCQEITKVFEQQAESRSEFIRARVTRGLADLLYTESTPKTPPKHNHTRHILFFQLHFFATLEFFGG
jgi:hypothetical protein